MKFRKPLKITQRVSSVTNSFVQAVIPWVPPSPTQQSEALKVLGMEHGIVCAYCGGVASDWDHLRPLVRNKRPTGYISDYKNLVPACGRCNQSKGAKEWRSWIVGRAAGSPASRGTTDLNKRIAALDRFESWGDVAPLPLEQLAAPDLWSKHWENLRRLEEALQDAQKHAAMLQAEVHRRFGANSLFLTPEFVTSVDG
ncbi:HNH endonuclease [Rhizobium lentis]|uniref:HNH endonuclease n=1 Tax=Rhizobium lentis TaxID=1138194 RepID=UPI001C83AD55|nr:HNH endonuclease [Rhizobium lentis]